MNVRIGCETYQRKVTEAVSKHRVKELLHHLLVGGLQQVVECHCHSFVLLAFAGVGTGGMEWNPKATTRKED